jgi:hypothetical protein
MDAQQLKAGLENFWGTELWHRNPMYGGMLYTDGVKFFADNAGGGAHWFLDIVGTEVMDIHKRGEEFIVVQLVSNGDSAKILADDGNGNLLWHREIDLTDCPAGCWKFYLENSVFMLPSER